MKRLSEFFRWISVVQAMSISLSLGQWHSYEAPLAFQLRIFNWLFSIARSGSQEWSNISNILCLESQMEMPGVALGGDWREGVGCGGDVSQECVSGRRLCVAKPWSAPFLEEGRTRAFCCGLSLEGLLGLFGQFNEEDMWGLSLLKHCSRLGSTWSGVSWRNAGTSSPFWNS